MLRPGGPAGGLDVLEGVRGLEAKGENEPMTITRRHKQPTAFRSVSWYSHPPVPDHLNFDYAGSIEAFESPIRTIMFPPRRGVQVISDVIDDASMPPEVMTRVCRDLGISAALSWLASHSATLRETDLDGRAR